MKEKQTRKEADTNQRGGSPGAETPIYIKRMRRAIPLVLLLVITAVWGWYMQITQEAAYYYRELRQLFLFDWDYVRSLLGAIGGVGTLVSQFLIQFFRVEGVGPWVTALLGGASAWFLWLSVRRIHSAVILLPFTVVPALLQSIYLITYSYHYEGMIALFMASLALYLYSHADRWRWELRLGLGGAGVVLLYFGFGSVALLFALLVLLYDVCRKNERWYAGFLLLILAWAIGALTVLAGQRPDYDTALWMKDYVEHFVELTPLFGFSWQSLLLLPPLFLLARYLPLRRIYAKALLCVAFVGLIGYGYVRLSLSPQVRDRDFYGLTLFFHYMDTEQWEAIPRSKALDTRNYMHLNCLNLALAKQGRLLTDLFKYPQLGVACLLADFHNFIEESFLYSQIYEHTGITALAFNSAFGASVGITYGSPLMARTIVRSHLIYGRYAPAEKFISLLEKTWAYRDWATAQRRFLYNDQAVENDPELGVRRRDLTDNETAFADYIGFLANLMLVVDTNPHDTAARDYLIAYLLLSKDMDGIKRFVETYSGTEVLPTLPDVLQQAIITYAEHDPAYCRQYGVSDKLLADFATFKQRVVSLRRARQDLASGMSAYRHTFWYYFMFTKLQDEKK